MIFMKILIIEDEERMRRLIKDYLKREYEIVEARDGKEGLDLFKRENPHLIILDVMLPIYDGWTVCRNIRKESNVPIIMLTARSEEWDELFGFELGVNDYVTKPFRPKILVARINSILKRQDKDNFEYGPLSIDYKGHRVFLYGEELTLSKTEYNLLTYLVKNKELALSREQILNVVWGYDYYGDERTVDTHIKRLRSKLKEGGKYIKTVRGIGYRFEVQL
ncbi:DNA-binding response regulator [Anaeromicrobium sediminis]|uniref:Stage 0 sporulation protein A homolog n=2 Tax=Anaeromicrobium sediminis TaxID=1478221 RepID=A0A267MKE8_9FIRM|nr:DNA-binding response regulator [Anaeromicrobium sediminis]